MYATPKFGVKLREGVTDVFHLERGIKQGDTLSIIIQSIY